MLLLIGARYKKVHIDLVVASVEAGRRQGQKGLSAVCAMVQVGASRLRSGQNEELRPWRYSNSSDCSGT